MRYKSYLTATLLLLLCSCVVMGQDLATYLPNMASDNMGDREKAQMEWQKICMQAGADAELKTSVNKQVAEQLGKDIPVETKEWLLHEIAWVGTADVVPSIAALLSDKEVRIRDEATRALAKIPAPEALAALKDALAKETDVANKQRLADAIGARTEKLTFGVETESPLNLPYISKPELEKWLANTNMTDEQKRQTVAALGVRGDKAYRHFVLDTLKQDDQDTLRAAIAALETLGEAADIPVLMQHLDFDRNLVIQTVSRIVGKDFDAALLKLMAAEKDHGKTMTYADILSRRYVPVAGVLLTKAKEKDCPNPLEYLKASEATATLENVPDMVDVFVTFTNNREVDEAERLVARICKGNSDTVVAKMTDANLNKLLPLLGRIGGEGALKTVKEKLATGNAQAKAAAFRALCNWPNAEVADDLLAIAKNNANESIQSSALRAFVRVITLPDEEIGIKISANDKLEKLKTAMTLAKRVEDKRLILDRAKAIRIVETLRFVMPYIDDAELKDTVCNTVAELAHQNFLRKPNKDEFGPALDKVLEVSGDNGLKDRVRRYRADL